jgi:predicted GH43/DUF377 family glycosyl hydrolase
MVPPDSASVQHPPSIAVQAAKAGFDASIFPMPPHKNQTFHFNNAFFVKDGKLWQAMRRTHLIGGHWHSCMSDCVVQPVHADMTVGKMEDVSYPRRSQNENVEDPRVIPWNDGFLVGLCSWERSSSPNLKPQQVLAYMDQNFTVKSIWTPSFGGNSGKFGGNSGTEKNWIWFEDGDGDLSFIYMTHPHTVCKTDTRSITHTFNDEYHAPWRYGHIRGGTPPVHWGNNEYLCIFHSSLPWKTVPRLGLRMRYFMGAYTFQNKPPFKVTSMTHHPILMGSDQDITIPQSPAVVFPCGLVRVKDDLLISLGVNDVACAWARIDQNLLAGWLEKVG